MLVSVSLKMESYKPLLSMWSLYSKGLMKFDFGNKWSVSYIKLKLLISLKTEVLSTPLDNDLLKLTAIEFNALISTRQERNLRDTEVYKLSKNIPEIMPVSISLKT